MITPQTNIDLKGIAEQFTRLDNFVICGHVSPDGDCIGSQLALFHALKALGKKVDCILARKDTVDEQLSFLPGVELMIPAADYSQDARTFVACDVPTPDRLGDGRELQAASEFTFTIDHHACEKSMSQFNYVDPEAASTSILVWELIKLLGVELSYEIALCSYVGLITDTGNFQFQNTNREAFVAAGEMTSCGIRPSDIAARIFQSRTLPSLRLEQLVLERMEVSEENSYVVSYLLKEDFKRFSASKEDAEPIINVLRTLKGVQVACLLREQEIGVRGSIRAKGDIDVRVIAQSFKGGGHKAAAGFTVFSPMDEALCKVGRALEKNLNKSPAREESVSQNRHQ